jgi:Tfp pilus assembly protein PilX
MTIRNIRRYDNEKGVAALLVVVIICVVALLIAVGASRLGLGEMEAGYVKQKNDQTINSAEGCMEEALERLRRNSAYAGGSLNISEGSCIITVVANGTARTITTSVTAGEYNKKIQVSATLGGAAIIINSWSEITL